MISIERFLLDREGGRDAVWGERFGWENRVPTYVFTYRHMQAGNLIYLTEGYGGTVFLHEGFIRMDELGLVLVPTIFQLPMTLLHHALPRVKLEKLFFGPVVWTSQRETVRF